MNGAASVLEIVLINLPPLVAAIVAAALAWSSRSESRRARHEVEHIHECVERLGPPAADTLRREWGESQERK